MFNASVSQNTFNNGEKIPTGYSNILIFSLKLLKEV
jgi:hypothetical protein